MTTSTSESGYHHGNLPSALLQAVEEIVAEQGVEAVSVRAVARRVGVSHTAPAHHFGDKRGLLTAFATQGFQRFSAALERAAQNVDDPEDALYRCGAAYVAFAANDTAHFNVMFRPELHDSDDLELDAAGAEAFGRLLACIARCRPTAPPDDLETKRLALYAWALVHGIAELFIDGPMGHLEPQMTVDDAYEMLAPTLLGGLRTQPGWINTTT